MTPEERSAPLPWCVVRDGEMVARFRGERDARGFAKARYGTTATVLNGRTHRDLVLSALKAGDATSGDLCAMTGIDRWHIWGQLDALQRRGLVVVVGLRHTRGRRAQLYRLARETRT
jgi:biotin operon repressor